VPGSYHNRGANFSFADGHTETHHWLAGETVQPTQPNTTLGSIAVSNPTDFQWLKDRTSVKK
jgi:prepilin-type processing-associated H-X9-DG protein